MLDAVREYPHALKFAWCVPRDFGFAFRELRAVDSCCVALLPGYKVNTRQSVRSCHVFFPRLFIYNQ